MSGALLRLEGVSVSYGAMRALHSVTLDVAEGSIVSLIGGNGAGKTTTLNAISGVVPASAGRMTFRDRPLDGVPAESRVGLGLSQVPEGRRVFPRMTVLENLQLGAYLRGADPGIAEDIETIGHLFPVLQARRDQPAGTLSGGEQQMLAIGRALMSRPRVLLMDEPTMGLAPQMVELILEKIVEIRDRGTTVLLVEQNAVEAIRLSDRVYVLRLGEIVHHGRGSEIDDSLLRALYLGHDL